MAVLVSGPMRAQAVAPECETLVPGSAGYEDTSGRDVEGVHQFRGHGQEPLLLGRADGRGVRQWHGLRILVHPADTVLVVQVRARRKTRHPDIGNDLPQIDTLSAM